MPKCKNDETRSYSGDEPSPKGRGYCAHAEEVGKRRKGKDGKFWVVRETKKGKRWFKVSESVKSPRGYGDYSPVARKGGPAYSPTERKKRQDPSVAKLGLSMDKIQRFEPGLYNKIARNVTGIKGQDPIGRIKQPFNNKTLRIAVNEYTTDPIMAIRKYGKISLWNTSQVTDMSKLFEYKEKFNADISSWDVSNVRNMSHMFNGARSFNQPIGTWDVSNVRNMEYMFSGSRFNQPIGHWNTSNVHNMAFMFYYSVSFNQPIDTKEVRANDGRRYLAWDVSNVRKMKYMFSNAFKFNQSINRWNVSNNVDQTFMFSESGMKGQVKPKWYQNWLSSLSPRERSIMETGD